MIIWIQIHSCLPLISGRAEHLEIRTGVLFFIASKEVNPKTSQYELKI